MPTHYLPPVTERGILVLETAPDSYSAFVWTGAETVGPIKYGASRAESVVEVWKSRLIAENRFAVWSFEHGTAGIGVVCKATAVPRRLTRSDRVEMLLRAVFQASCRAAIRGNRAEVDRLDARYKAIEHAAYPHEGQARVWIPAISV